MDHCGECRSAGLHAGERGDEESALYAGGTYVAGPPSADRFLVSARRLAARARLRFLRGMPAGTRVFDVGAGDGRFLTMLAARGFSVDGTEPFGRDRNIGAAVARSDRVEDLNLAPASQDVIVFWHVLEHLNQPAAALDRLRPALAPGGRLIVAVPNIDSLQARLGGDRWFHQDAPRHAVHFTVRGIRQLFARCGFAVTAVHHFVPDQNLLGMWQTLLNRLTRDRDVAYRFLKLRGAAGLRHPRRDLAATAVGGAPLLPIAVAMEIASALLRRGGSVVVEGRAA